MRQNQQLMRSEEDILDLGLPSNLDMPPVLPAAHGYDEDGALDEAPLLRTYWQAARRRLWLIIGLTVLATTLAALYVARQPDVYQAEARVQVNLENNGSLLGAAKNGSVIFNNPVSDPAYFNTQLQNLTDPVLLHRVVETLDLEHRSDILHRRDSAHPVWQSLRRMVGLDPAGAGAMAQSAAPQTVPLASTLRPATGQVDLQEVARLAPYVKAFAEDLKVEPVIERRTGPVKETRLIDIRFTHTDPQLSAQVVNTLADAFARANLEQKTETNENAGDFLQKRVAELQAQIRAGEERLITYAKQNQILSLDATQNTVVERLAGLNRQLLEAENERKLAESAYRAALAPGAADALAADNARQIDAAETKLAELRQRRAQLLVENTEDWPEVKETNQQIATIERQIGDARARASTVVLTNLETRYRQAQTREDALRASFNQQRGETLSQNEAAINYRIIQQEIETNKGLLDGLLQRAKENDVVLAGMPSNVYVAHYAVVPTEPVGPKRLLNILLAAVLALAAGVGLALLLHHLDDAMRSVEDVEKNLRLPTLALVPALGGRRARRRLLGGARPVGGNGQTGLLVSADQCSPVVEAFRQLRTAVMLSTAGHAPQTVLVTSSQPGEGKSTVAANMAAVLAQTGARVLLVDADMRRPRQHEIFGCANGRGLSTILSRPTSEAELLSLIERHRESGVYILPAGVLPPNPAELLSSVEMRRLLGTLEATFTHVIIDSPPVASVTDGVLLAALADGVLLVVHGGECPRALARRTRKLLATVGARLLGVVLNNVNLSQQGYYYGDYYQNGHDDADITAAPAQAMTGDSGSTALQTLNLR